MTRQIGNISGHLIVAQEPASFIKWHSFWKTLPMTTRLDALFVNLDNGTLFLGCETLPEGAKTEHRIVSVEMSLLTTISATFVLN